MKMIPDRKHPGQFWSCEDAMMDGPLSEIEMCRGNVSFQGECVPEFDGFSLQVCSSVQDSNIFKRLTKSVPQQLYKHDYVQKVRQRSGSSSRLRGHPNLIAQNPLIEGW